LRQDIENGRRFDLLTEHLASLAIAQGRAQRAAHASIAATDIAATKKSRRSASGKLTAKQHHSSRRCLKRSGRKR
jgi:hypothetical protein